MMRKSLIFGSIGMIILTSNASATLITFDDGQPNETAIGSFYSGQGVTFTDAKWTDNFGLPGTTGAQAVASISGGYNPPQDQPIGAMFASTMSSVTLRGIDVGANGFRLKGFDASNTLVDNEVVFGTGDGTGEFFDLTVQGQIKRVEFSADNLLAADGLIFDNLSYTAAPVPEPATLAALGSGLVVLLKKRRRK